MTTELNENFWTTQQSLVSESESRVENKVSEEAYFYWCSDVESESQSNSYNRFEADYNLITRTAALIDTKL